MRALAGTLRQRRSLGRILGDTFAFYRSDWQAFVVVASATIPVSVAGALVADAIEDDLTLGAAMAVFVLASILVSAVVQAANMAHLDAIDRGQPSSEAASAGAALQRARTVLAVWLAFSLAGALAIGPAGVPTASLQGGAALGASLGKLALFAFGIYWMVRWLFALPAVIFEGAGIREALGTSSRLVKAEWWLTFGRFVALLTVLAFVNLILPGLAANAPLPLSATMAAIVTAFTLPYFAIALSLMYFDAKLRRQEAAGFAG